jgi:CheY-like chemotaxis protein
MNSLNTSETAHQRHQARILILEDDPVILESLTSALQASGFEALTTVNCLADALQSLKTEAFDIALVDLNLPDGLGFTLIETHAVGPFQYSGQRKNEITECRNSVLLRR